MSDQDAVGNSAVAASVSSGSAPKGDPIETTTGDGDDEVTIGVGAPSLSNASNEIEQQPDAEVAENSMQIKQLHSEQDPLMVFGQCTPESAQLYTSDETGDVVTHTVGTIEQPSWYPVGEPSLFINGMPWMDDIAQGQIGDCYLMAVLQSAVGPLVGQLMGMFSEGGDMVSVTFHQFDKESKSWSPVTITTDKKTIMVMDEEGNPSAQHGAEYRVATSPASGDWYTMFGGGYLTIQEDAHYEMALWVAIMEKAYAEFCETYGQYGGYRSKMANDQTDEDGDAISGVDIMDGGYEQIVMKVLFGGEMSESFDTETEMADVGSNQVPEGSKSLIEQLLALDGEGVEDGKASLLHASTDVGTTYERLLVYIPEVEEYVNSRKDDVSDQLGWSLSSIGDALSEAKDAWDDGAVHLAWYLDELKEECGKYPDLESDSDEEKANIERIAEICSTLIDPETSAALHDGTSAALTGFLELAAQATTAGTDTSDGQRFVYAGHAYAVLGAQLNNTAGESASITLENLSDNLATIDTLQSTVKMANPHHGNEVDLDGTGPEDGADDGQFSMTLDQFMRGFSNIQGGVVEQ